MKALIVMVILVAIGLILLIHKKENNIQKMLFSFGILFSIIGLAVVGNVMRSIMPLFLAHIIALIMAYGGLIYYILRERKQWIFWSLPIGTLAIFIVIAWIGNEHIIWFS